MSYKLSILDQCPIRSGSTPSEAIREMMELACLADVAGYHRFWLAEHHGASAVAGVAPEILIGPVAMATSRIRVGSGGVLLSNYMPFKVAESFSLLAALAPGRIDLGIGRGAGGGQHVADALQSDPMRFLQERFYASFEQLIDFLNPSTEPETSASMLRACLPLEEGNSAQLWVLGSSPSSAVWAAERGLPYCFADFINSKEIAAVQLYRERFVKRTDHDRPYVMAAVWAIAASDLAEANMLAAPLRLMMSQTRSFDLSRVPRLIEALKWQNALLAPPPVPDHLILGSPRQVKASLDAFAETWKVDELMIVNMLADHEQRKQSYRSLADEF